MKRQLLVILSFVLVAILWFIQRPISNPESTPSLGKPAAEPRAVPRSTNPATTPAITDKLPNAPRIIQRWPEDLPVGQNIGWAGLKARRVPPKEALHIPAGEKLRLTVKFADDLSARADRDGHLILHTKDPGRFQNLGRAAVTHELRFQRIHSVSDEQIADLCRRAAANTGEAQADLAAHLQIIPRDPKRDSMISLARELHEMPEVEYAELASLDVLPPPPAADMAPVTPLLVSNQSYRRATPGLNLDHVWNTYGVRGAAELKVTDCEYMFNPSHEDLSGLIELQPDVIEMYAGFSDNHGTAVLGVIASAWNGYGTSGAVPDCTTRFFPEYSTLSTGIQYRDAAVTAAIATSSSGDIVVLEMQADGPAAGSSDFVPAEYELAVWNAVKTGSNAGVITIAAAGNGKQNLDGPLFSEYHSRGDSGAIIVGSGTTDRVRTSTSSYGARVNVQGWGQSVFTTGYGTFATYGGDVNQEYTSSFNGTSSATAVVAGAAALLQSTAIKISGIRLTPAAMRNILINSGQAQTGIDAATAKIGPLPDLQAATAALFSSYPATFATLASWSYYHFATPSPDLTDDADGDGLVNLIEYILGTDPTGTPPGDSAFLPKLSTGPDGQGGSQWSFEFHQPASRTGASWTIISSASLAANRWTPLIHGTNGISITRNGETIRASGPVTSGNQFLRLQAKAN